MRRHRLLSSLHQKLQPRNYLEIGVRNGYSLDLSRARTIAVDPAFSLTEEVHCDLHLVRTTSDEFFARKHPLAHFTEPVIDLAFIDGMHLAEYALRDFINIERFCRPGSVIVLDDVLPRSVEEGGRTRVGAARAGAWTGDVYKTAQALRDHRPDLVVLEVNTLPTGTLVVLLPDHESRVLHRAYDDLVIEMVSPDPQDVPIWALERTRAVAPEVLLAANIWDAMPASRALAPSAARRHLGELLASSGLDTRQVG